MVVNCAREPLGIFVPAGAMAEAPLPEKHLPNQKGGLWMIEYKLSLASSGAVKTPGSMDGGTSRLGTGYLKKATPWKSLDGS